MRHPIPNLNNQYTYHEYLVQLIDSAKNASHFLINAFSKLMLTSSYNCHSFIHSFGLSWCPAPLWAHGEKFSSVLSLLKNCQWRSRLPRGQLYHPIYIFITTYKLFANFCCVISYYKHSSFKAINRCYLGCAVDRELSYLANASAAKSYDWA